MALKKFKFKGNQVKTLLGIFFLLLVLIAGAIFLARDESIKVKEWARECECGQYAGCGSGYKCSNATCGTCVKNSGGTTSTPPGNTGGGGKVGSSCKHELEQCGIQNGVSYGKCCGGLTCGPHPIGVDVCQVTSKSCTSNGSCLQLGATCCSGNYVSDGTCATGNKCAPAPSCTGNGKCMQLDSGCCSGNYVSDGTCATGNRCATATGCISNGKCSQVDKACCSGNYYSDGFCATGNRCGTK